MHIYSIGGLNTYELPTQSSDLFYLKKTKKLVSFFFHITTLCLNIIKYTEYIVPMWQKLKKFQEIILQGTF